MRRQRSGGLTAAERDGDRKRERRNESTNYGRITASRFIVPASVPQDDRVRRVEQVELDDVDERRDLLGRDTGRAGHRIRQARCGAELIGGDLQHAVTGVGHQHVLMAVLLVEDHVDRLVAGAEFGDRRAASPSRPA